MPLDNRVLTLDLFERAPLRMFSAVVEVPAMYPPHIYRAKKVGGIPVVKMGSAVFEAVAKVCTVQKMPDTAAGNRVGFFIVSGEVRP